MSIIHQIKCQLLAIKPLIRTWFFFFYQSCFPDPKEQWKYAKKPEHSSVLIHITFLSQFHFFFLVQKTLWVSVFSGTKFIFLLFIWFAPNRLWHPVNPLNILLALARNIFLRCLFIQESKIYCCCHPTAIYFGLAFLRVRKWWTKQKKKVIFPFCVFSLTCNK